MTALNQPTDVDVQALARLARQTGIRVSDLLETLLDQSARVPAVDEPERSLTDAEHEALALVGVTVRPVDQGLLLRNAMTRLQARALWPTVAQVAERLGIGTSMVRKRLGAGQLLGEHDHRNAWRIPAWQFAGSQIVPGLTDVLPRVPAGLDLDAVEQFFTEPNPDLIVDEIPVSPLTWLATGHDPSMVVPLVATLDIA